MVDCTSLVDIYRHYSLSSWRISSCRRFYRKSDSFIDILQDEQWAPSTSLGYRRSFNRRFFLRFLTRNFLLDSQRSIAAVGLGSSMTSLQTWTASSGTWWHSADETLLFNLFRLYDARSIQVPLGTRLVAVNPISRIPETASLSVRASPCSYIHRLIRLQFDDADTVLFVCLIGKPLRKTSLTSCVTSLKISEVNSNRMMLRH